jgi:hypothetical protein
LSTTVVRIHNYEDSTFATQALGLSNPIRESPTLNATRRVGWSQ